MPQFSRARAHEDIHARGRSPVRNFAVPRMANRPARRSKFTSTESAWTAFRSEKFARTKSSVRLAQCVKTPYALARLDSPMSTESASLFAAKRPRSKSKDSASRRQFPVKPVRWTSSARICRLATPILNSASAHLKWTSSPITASKNSADR